jgi:hypothetical protein
MIGGKLMGKIYMDYKNSDPGDNNDWNPMNRKLMALGTKMIAEARKKDKKNERVTKKKRMSRKEYINNMAMKQKWWDHYGRNPWY